ncbi:MAG: MBL fold metallo-hydrolase [Nitrospinae bacterium]|nr:MBL fold metallo-hydrolase [Nitrospinota bacterium]MBL7021534.1 MBL fold metallo-hydrolase [Nitrospinaceae bacterium]
MAGFKWLAGAGLFISFLAVSGLCSAESFKTVEVWKNLFTVTNGDGVDSNTTFLITRDGVVVVDTRVTPNEAKKVLAEIRKRTDLPILYTINTHYHGDHTFGNQVFEGSGPIIAHESVRKNLFGDLGKGHLESFKSRNIPGMDETVVTPPNMVFKDEMEIFVGGYNLRLMHVRGHTDGDVFIYIDQLKTLITGDLVVYRNVPSMRDAYVEEWISAMDVLSDFDAEIYIPGHGESGGKPVLIAMKHYLLKLKEMVLNQLGNGKSLKETQDAIRPVFMEKFKNWKNLDRLDANIQRAYLEYSLKQGS